MNSPPLDLTSDCLKGVELGLAFGFILVNGSDRYADHRAELEGGQHAVAKQGSDLAVRAGPALGQVGHPVAGGREL